MFKKLDVRRKPPYFLVNERLTQHHRILQRKSEAQDTAIITSGVPFYSPELIAIAASSMLDPESTGCDSFRFHDEGRSFVVANRVTVSAQL
jgi:hypothetical protein